MGGESVGEARQTKEEEACCETPMTCDVAGGTQLGERAHTYGTV